MESLIELDNKNETAEDIKLMPWQKVCDPPKQFFHARVLCVDLHDKEKFWVVEENQIQLLLDMIEEMHATFSNNLEPLEASKICVDGLVAVSIANHYCRAVIKKIIENDKMCGIVLIDSGSKKKVPFKALYKPTPMMQNTKAFVFAVRPQRYAIKLEGNSIVSIKILEKISENHFVVQFGFKLPQPKILFLDERGPLELKLHKVLNDGQGALLQIIDKKFISKWKLDLDFISTRLINVPVENGTIVAVQNKNNVLKRASVIYNIIPAGCYLVYLIDDGNITITRNVRVMSNNYICTYPARVVYVQTKNGNTVLAKLKLSDRISCSAVITNSEHIIESNIPRTLEINNNFTIEVFAKRLLAMEHKYWKEPLLEDGTVYITHYLSHAEVYISAAITKCYNIIYRLISNTLVPFQKNDIISVGDIVMVISNHENYYFRAEIKHVGLDNDTFDVFDIDTGATFTSIPIKYLYKIQRYLTLFPLYLKKVKLALLNDIEPHLVPTKNMAIELLKQYVERKSSFLFTYMDSNSEVVELSCIKSTSTRTINKELLPLAFLVAGTIYKFHHLQRLDSPSGNKFIFIILSASGLRDGYLTGAHFGNMRDLLQIKHYEKRINNYCKSTMHSDSIAFERNQLCLAYDADASKWYRAIILNFNGNNLFTVVKFDMGTTAIVPKTSILPITEELLFPLFSNKYYIKDYSKLNGQQNKILMESIKPYNVITANIETSFKYKSIEKNTFIIDIIL